MKAILSIELIGDDLYQRCKLQEDIYNHSIPGLGTTVFGGVKRLVWVAQILGKDDKYKYKRCFLPHKIDYTNANSIGSRGVYANYILETGNLYEVSERPTWRRTIRYFCYVDEQSDINKIKEEDIGEWLQNLKKA